MARQGKSSANYSNTKTYNCRRCSVECPWRYTGANLYCSRSCAAKDMAKQKKELYKNNEEVRQKISKGWFKKGEQRCIATQFKNGHTPWHKGRTGVYTEEKLKRITEANQKNAEMLSGSNSPHWKGGKPLCIECNTIFNYYKKGKSKCAKCKRKDRIASGVSISRLEEKRLRSMFKQKERIEVLERDDYTCQQCHERGGYLHVDHIKPWAKYPELRFDIDNCQTLCMGCHYEKTFKRKIPKGIVWGIQIGG